jgi:hypothetical protein
MQLKGFGCACLQSWSFSFDCYTDNYCCRKTLPHVVMCDFRSIMNSISLPWDIPGIPMEIHPWTHWLQVYSPTYLHQVILAIFHFHQGMAISLVCVSITSRVPNEHDLLLITDVCSKVGHLILTQNDFNVSKL